ncbi:hypothetical protein LJR027_004072 [Terrabacter sp. LjRoot27]|uniref:hypothetical protein n=1 Tax=Terrabacter sp. LjRoot27 TaxID=3342306 RepID=UPI003ECEC99E
MGRAGLCVGMAVAALFVGGCGSATPDDGSTGGVTPAAPTATSSTTSALRFGAAGDDALGSSYGPAFPLTLRRTGGIAGFDDQVVLEANGRVRVETRSVHGRVCTLSAPQQRQLVTLLATLRLGPSTTAPSTDGSLGGDPDAVPESDPITISVTDHQARAIDLSDPSLGEISGLVGVLVSDVTLSVPATTRCTTPSTPVAPPAAPAP